MKILNIVSILVAITIFSANSYACEPRCWAGDNPHAVSGEPLVDSGTVVDKAYDYGLETYLSPGTDNAYNDDSTLYAIREVLLYKEEHASIVSRAYQHLWPNVNINFTNASVYHDFLSDFIPEAYSFISFLNGNMPSSYDQQQVISSNLANNLQLVINENKGISPKLDQLLEDIEDVLSDVRNMTAAEIAAYCNYTPSHY